MRQFHRLVVTLSLSCFAGCGSTVLDLRDDLNLHLSSFHERLTADKVLTQRFLACIRQLPSDRTEQATLPESRSSLEAVRAIIQRMRERQPQQADSLLALQDMVNDLADPPRRRITFTTLHTAVDAIRRWHAHLDFDEDNLAQDSSRFGRLLLAYNKAYFGDLRFKGDPAVQASDRHRVMKVTSHGFVDRSGNVWRFPGLSSDPPSSDQTAPPSAAVNSQRLTADLTRIFVEAFFDAAFQVPAIHGATALRVEWASSEQSYPEFDADRPAIPLEALARLTRDALRAEATVTAAIGKAVRGGSVFGTQNETLAASLETAAGVMAKKLIEHEGFCYFQVTQGTPVAGNVSR